MPIETDVLRTAMARLIVAGDFQEVRNLYAGGDVALAPEEITRLYPPDGLSAEDREALEEVRSAIPDELLPPLDRRATAPGEIVELTARFALERGKSTLAVRSLREADSVDKVQRAYAAFAIGSIEAGEMPPAAFELSLAARLAWARTAPEARREFIVSLGVHPAELASSVGAESARGRVSGGRALPDFPAWQTYGPLLHARCHVQPCVSDLPLEASVPLAVRYLLHSPELSDQAVSTTGDALKLLKALAAELDPNLPDFARRHAEAMARYQELHDEHLIRDTRLAQASEAEGPAGADRGEETEGAPEEGTVESAEGEEPEEEVEPETPPEEADKTEAARQGLREVQAILLGRRENEWRNALSELASTHPLSVFTVCTVRGTELGAFVIPAGQRATEFLEALTADR